jgi:hypothetical protein
MSSAVIINCAMELFMLMTDGIFRSELSMPIGNCHPTARGSGWEALTDNREILHRVILNTVH